MKGPTSPIPPSEKNLVPISDEPAHPAQVIKPGHPLTALQQENPPSQPVSEKNLDTMNMEGAAVAGRGRSNALANMHPQQSSHQAAPLANDAAKTLNSEVSGNSPNQTAIEIGTKHITDALKSGDVKKAVGHALYVAKIDPEVTLETNWVRALESEVKKPYDNEVRQLGLQLYENTSEKSAAGSKTAALHIGHMFRDQKFGIQGDISDSSMWYRKALPNEDARRALKQLGMM